MLALNRRPPIGQQPNRLFTSFRPILDKVEAAVLQSCLGQSKIV